MIPGVYLDSRDVSGVLEEQHFRMLNIGLAPPPVLGVSPSPIFKTSVGPRIKFVIFFFG